MGCMQSSYFLHLLMRKVLRDLDGVHVYADYILLTNPSVEHYQLLHTVLDRLRATGLKLAPGKCCMFQTTLSRRGKCSLCQFRYFSVHRRAELMQHVDTLSRPHEPRAGDESATEQQSAVSAAQPELSSSGVFSERGSADPPAVGDSVPETADRIRIADQFRPELPASVGP